MTYDAGCGVTTETCARSWSLWLEQCLRNNTRRVAGRYFSKSGSVESDYVDFFMNFDINECMRIYKLLVLQIHKLLKGLPPIKSLMAVSSGAAKLVSLPMKNYKKDHRLLKGMQRGRLY